MKRILITLILSAIAVLPSHATPPSAGDLDSLLLSGDTNGDGVVSKVEFLTLRAAAFHDIDTDASGTVTVSELESVLNDRIRRFSSQAFKTIDKDGNGAISAQEWSSAPSRGFDLADRNNDGVLDDEERARPKR